MSRERLVAVCRAIKVFPIGQLNPLTSRSTSLLPATSRKQGNSQYTGNYNTAYQSFHNFPPKKNMKKYKPGKTVLEVIKIPKIEILF
jgi:hypothetical protein